MMCTYVSSIKLHIQQTPEAMHCTQLYNHSMFHYEVAYRVSCEVTASKCVIKTHGSVSCGPRKRCARKRSEYIDRNNKVAIFTHLQLRDSLSKWHQIYSGVSLHEGEATFRILTRSLKLFLRYESAKFRKNFFVFFYFFFFVISHTLKKSP